MLKLTIVLYILLKHIYEILKKSGQCIISTGGPLNLNNK